MSTSENTYVNKNNQAPSYCDRAMFKSNASSEHQIDFYRCMHNIVGSDHRPVQMGVTLKGFGHPRFVDLPRMLDPKNPRQGFGQIKPNLVSISYINFSKSLVLKKLIVPQTADGAVLQQTLNFRLSFYDISLDKVTAPINFSQLQEIVYGGATGVNLERVSTSWSED